MCKKLKPHQGNRKSSHNLQNRRHAEVRTVKTDSHVQKLNPIKGIGRAVIIMQKIITVKTYMLLKTENPKQGNIVMQTKPHQGNRKSSHLQHHRNAKS